MTKFALVNVENGTEYLVTNRLPWSPPPPNKPMGRLATFTEVGQEVDGLRVVERVETERQNRYQISIGSTSTWDGQKITVTHQWGYHPLDQLKARRVSEIKDAASNIILERFPSYKQANMTARSVELQDIWRLSGVWTAEEQVEADAIKAAWAWVKAVRAHSNALEAEVMALSTADAVANWPMSGWPA
jgi:hypothetical protein